jgi:DNA polymerase-3 subunit alpha
VQSSDRFWGRVFVSSQFVHLHLHTQYSLLDGANKIPEVLEEAKKLGQPAIAITDHGNMHGVLEFYDIAQTVGIKSILGCEFYLNPLSRHERKTKLQGGAPTHHLTVLAKNNDGYHNLCRLATLAYKEGFYFKPRIDHELLQKYREGLIVLSGCLSGELAHHIKLDDEKGLHKALNFYLETFGEDFFLEIQPHQIPEQKKINKACIALSKEFGVELVATNDCHYLKKEDAFAQEVLMCIATGKLITDPDRMRHEGCELYLRSADEMREAFGTDYPLESVESAISNTVAIAEKCELHFDFSKYFMPKYDLKPGKTLIESMSDKARAGLETRLKTMQEQGIVVDHKVYEERLEREIGLIDTMGFAGYFLVVADFINWSKDHGVPVGPGRGSAAGSLVAFAMRITSIDPIRHKLLFERFLNPERVSLPDIDVDFCIKGRSRVIEYVSNRYGKDRVSQIGTFGTLKAKGVIKDVGRVLGIPYGETDRVAQLVLAPRQGADCPLEEAIKMEKKLADYAAGEGKQLIDLALKLEGLTRHTSTHAAGVVIGEKPLSETLPLLVDKDGNDVTQFAAKYVEKVGLVKFDFLGLKTLTVIYAALAHIKETHGKDIDIDNLPVDDALTYEMLCSGETIGVFQLESSGITEMTMRLKPSCFDDLVAILALYRPGPLDAGMVDRYIERKQGREEVNYLHESMEPILADTYGIILYQEQIMQLVQSLAGYSLGEADILRRAMGKKKVEEMAKQRGHFVEGALKNGTKREIATEIFDQMETFARYGFNRSHSAAYAMVTYQTAYLKTHYPVEFMAALLSHEMEDSDKTLKNLTECRNRKIDVLPPDVNLSASDFSVSDGKIRYGLSAIKGVGDKAAQAVVDERQANGSFKDLEDFVTRVDLRSINKRVLENFIKCGAFDFSEVSRHEMFDSLDDILKAGQSLQKNKDSLQIELFGSAEFTSIQRRRTNTPEWPINQKLAFEREALGFYISGHPLEKYKLALAGLGVCTTEKLREGGAQKSVSVGGVVTALRLKNTKKGDRYASFILEDWLGTVETIVWPSVYAEYSHILVADDPIVATGRVDVGEGRCTLVVEKLESLIDIRDRKATQGVLSFKADDEFDDRLELLKKILKKHEGTCPICAKVQFRTNEEVSLKLGDGEGGFIKVIPSEELSDEVEQLFGRLVLTFQ